MYHLSDLVGKTVVDGADVEIGEVDGLNVTYSVRFRTPHIHFRVKGEKIISLRGRKTEFIPLNEIDEIEECVHLYKEFDTISKIIKGIHMEDEETYRVKEFIGMDVVDSTGAEVGVVRDAAIGRERKRLFLIVEGPRVKDIWSKHKKAIAFDNVKRIDEEIMLNGSYSSGGKS